MIGRPNVGKSSLVNRFLGRRAGDRLRASRAPRATRSTLPLEVDGRERDPRRHRRPAARGPRCSESVEYYTPLRSQRAAERADVALVVCDAADGVTAQDLRVAELAMQSGCATAARAQQVGPRAPRRRPRPRARPRRTEAAPAPARADRQRARPAATSSRLLAEALALADRARAPHPHARAQPLPRRRRRRRASRRPAQGTRLKLLYMAQIGDAPAALRDPGQRPQPVDARLRLLRREPAARALRARGRPADHRLRRARASATRASRPPSARLAARPARRCAAARPTTSASAAPAVGAARSSWWSSLVLAALRRRRHAARDDRAPARPRPTRSSSLTPVDRRQPRRRQARAGGSPGGCPSFRAARAGARAAAGRAAARSTSTRDVRPWLGNEAALAAAAHGTTAAPLIVLASRPRQGRGVHRRAAGGSGTRQATSGVEIRRLRGGSRPRFIARLPRRSAGGASARRSPRAAGRGAALAGAAARDGRARLPARPRARRLRLARRRAPAARAAGRRCSARRHAARPARAAGRRRRR